MLTIKAKLKDITKTFENDLILSFSTNSDNLSAEVLTGLQEPNKDFKIDICQWREKRSIDSNAYCWLLLDEIAKKINSTKEDVYREIIKRVGVFEVLPIRTIAVNEFIDKWQNKGLGWICDVIGESKLPNYTNIMAYFGTSTYNTKEMSRFIDEVVQEAENLGIQTKTPDEIAEMKSLWGEYEKHNTK